LLFLLLWLKLVLFNLLSTFEFIDLWVFEWFVIIWVYTSLTS
jgi:hypothetical protein